MSTLPGLVDIAGDVRPEVSPRDQWRTPRALVAQAEEQLGRMVLDLAATAEDRVCPRHIGPDRDWPYWDARSLRWLPRDELRYRLHYAAGHQEGPCWLNPPYSQGGGPLWRWEELAARVGEVRPVAFLGPATPDSGWFQDAWEHAAEVWLYRQRVRFLRPDGRPAPHPRTGAVLFVYSPHVRGPARVRWVDVPTPTPTSPEPSDVRP